MRSRLHLDIALLTRAVDALPRHWRSLDPKHAVHGDLPGMRDPTSHAGVLVALEPTAEGFALYFTQRTLKLKNHAGQISFPGGRVDRDDADPIAAALREAHEEIGLSPDGLKVLGVLDSYDTITGFRVTPVVAIVERPFVPELAPDEVEAVFSVPLSFFLDQRNLQQRHAPYLGLERSYYGYQFGAHWIWGATAGMLRAFCSRLEHHAALDLTSSAVQLA
jgi:8-oxo-dGTP pyrophosphatase MutT (NUDIX family)